MKFDDIVSKLLLKVFLDLFDHIVGLKCLLTVAGPQEQLAKEFSGSVFSGFGEALRSGATYHLRARPRPVNRSPVARGPAAKVGAAAPEFVLAGMKSDKVSFRELTKGKVVYLNFWGYT